jgi:hypothetical protein
MCLRRKYRDLAGLHSAGNIRVVKLQRNSSMSSSESGRKLGMSRRFRRRKEGLASRRRTSIGTQTKKNI